MLSPNQNLMHSLKKVALNHETKKWLVVTSVTSIALAVGVILLYRQKQNLSFTIDNLTIANNQKDEIISTQKEAINTLQKNKNQNPSRPATSNDHNTI